VINSNTVIVGRAGGALALARTRSSVQTPVLQKRSKTKKLETSTLHYHK
jgi:hypothetical protein